MVGLGFFAPLPLAVMIPFMAMQSGAMALAFGTYFQYGKRRISAMSNEEFNAIQPGDIYKGITDTINAMIPSFREQNASMQGLQQEILKQLMEYAKQAAQTLPGQIGDVVKAGAQTIGAKGPIEAFGAEIIKIQNSMDQISHDISHALLPHGYPTSEIGTTPNQLYIQPQNQPGFIGPPKPGPSDFEKLGISETGFGPKQPVELLPSPVGPTVPIKKTSSLSNQSYSIEVRRIQKNINAWWERIKREDKRPPSQSKNTNLQAWRLKLQAEQQDLINFMAKHPTNKMVPS